MKLDAATVVAIGKAGPSMVRGAALAVGTVSGVCVSDHDEPIPDGVRMLVGDHPVPGRASDVAAKAAITAVEDADPTLPLMGLISGGGSAVCETPRDGVSINYLAAVNDRLIKGGATIQQTNLIRGHLSLVKCGGLAAKAGRPIDTYVISDVAGAPPQVIASGPTIPTLPDPETARALMDQFDIEVPADVWGAMCQIPAHAESPDVTLLADGRDAALAAAKAAGPESSVRSEWLEGDVSTGLSDFFEGTEGPISIAVGEPVVEVTADGRGGRNTHAALLAASMLTGSNDLFVAFATDGLDGKSASSGAIVDGDTLAIGGDPSRALETFDSADYLEGTGDLLPALATGTNVSDLWILWRRGR